jgi:hypothetical protein
MQMQSITCLTVTTTAYNTGTPVNFCRYSNTGIETKIPVFGQEFKQFLNDLFT